MKNWDLSGDIAKQIRECTDPEIRVRLLKDLCGKKVGEIVVFKKEIELPEWHSPRSDGSRQGDQHYWYWWEENGENTGYVFNPIKNGEYWKEL